MSTVTPVLGLIKPGDSEYIDVADLNANFDALDAAWLAQDIIRVTDSDPLDPVTAVSTGQIQFKDNSVWKGLDEVRLYNNSDALYCKDGVTTGLLMQNNQIKIVPVTWNNGVPAVGTAKGYIDANGDYHSANTSLETLRESVNNKVDTVLQGKAGYDLNDQPTGATWGGNNFSNAPSLDYYTVTRISYHVQIAVLFSGNTSQPILFVRSKVNDIGQPGGKIVRVEGMQGSSMLYYISDDVPYIQLRGEVNNTLAYFMQFDINMAKLDFYKYENGINSLIKSFK